MGSFLFTSKSLIAYFIQSDEGGSGGPGPGWQRGKRHLYGRHHWQARRKGDDCHHNAMLVVVITIDIAKNPILVTFSWKVGDSPLAGSGGYADSR